MERGLSGPIQLQNWFTARLRVSRAEYGRVLIGWDEMNDACILDGAVLLAWRDVRHGDQGAAAGQEFGPPAEVGERHHIDAVTGSSSQNGGGGRSF